MNLFPLTPRLCVATLLVVIFTTTTTIVHSVVIKVENLPEKCDFSKCTAPDTNANVVNVHLVPHTHDDVGWLKTVDQYYYGAATRYQKAGVQYILDSVVEELIRNKERRFIYVETAFFWKWWLEQSDEQRDIVKELVKTGQLEFINGGWSMNDEATTHYNSIIDQMSWGLRRLNDTFGHCGVPRVAWQIDPFGHSREHANLIAQMNYDALYFAREDYEDHDKRSAARTLEHVWQGSDDLGDHGDLFTGMMHMGYGPPGGFNWDLTSTGDGDPPVVDNVDSDEYNVPSIVSRLEEKAIEYATHYATNNVLFPMGTDFQYQDAHVYFKNMDKLIKAVNAQSKRVKIFYSTPSCYTKALHDVTNHTWTGKRDDYFPYASDPHSYWTGYFTSRPALKRMEREGNNVLQACKQIDTLAHNGGKFDQNITVLREIMGVMQHHDAVAGTEKQHVTDNYAKHLASGIDSCVNVILNSYEQSILPKSSSPKLSSTSKASAASPLKQHYCSYLNISACDATESNEQFVVQIYNPLAHSIANRTIRIPVVNGQGKFYQVNDPDGKSVSAFLVPIPDGVKSIPSRHSKATHELVFRANLPPLGLVSYFVSTSKTRSTSSAAEPSSTKISANTVVKGKSFSATFDGTGQLLEISLDNGKSIKLNSTFRYYRGALSSEGRASGAYVFRPTSSDTYDAAKLTEALYFTTTTSKDPYGTVQEIHQKFDSYISQVIRIDEATDAIEFDWVVGPIPVNDGVPKEIVARYESELNTNSTFWTDANGRQLLQRKWNYRPTWRLSVTEPTSGNYYPVNSRIFVRDEKRKLQLTVLNDRSQGGTSPTNGAVELMVHRRLLDDDGFGVGEPLSEPGVNGKGLVVRGKHVLVVDPIDKAAAHHRPLAQQLLLQPLITFTTGITEEEYRKQYSTNISGLTTQLPPNIHLLTLEQWNDGRYLIRLENYFQQNEDEKLSAPASVSLKNLFTGAVVTSAEELTLGANQPVEALKNRLQFKYTKAEGSPKNQEIMPPAINPKELVVTLLPMQIRTFVVKLEHK